jgi:hypothetical protein
VSSPPKVLVSESPEVPTPNPSYLIRSYTAGPELVRELREASARYDLAQTQIIRRGIRRELDALAKEQA